MVHMTFQKMLYVFRIFGTITNTWPPRSDTGKRKLFREFYYHFIMITFLVVWIPMTINAYKNWNNIGILMKGISHIAALAEAFLNMVLCTANRRELQNLLSNIEEFTNTPKDYEKVILQKYVGRYSTYILVVATCFIIAGITFIVSPLFLPLEFPADAWYPFSTDPLLRRVTIYLMQIFMAAFTAFSFCVDVLITIFLSYLTARIEILSLELQQSINETQVISCIIKHQELISFITKTQRVIQYILLKSVFCMAFTVISSCFPLLYIESRILIPQFMSMILAALSRMYVTAWPANDLKEISMEFALSAYNIAWIGKSRRMQNNLLIMIQRSQKPLLIFMSGIFPALTLEFFSSFVTTVMSYFMTMRATIM